MKVQERGTSVYAVALGWDFQRPPLGSVSSSEASDATTGQRGCDKSHCLYCTESNGSSRAQGPGSGECMSPGCLLIS